MRYERILGSLFLVFMFFSFVSASQTNSSNYQMDVATSSGGSNVSSSNYKTNVILGTIAGSITSTLYKQFLGFFYIFRVEEEEEEAPPDEVPSNGGGAPTISNFNVDKDLIKVLIKQGETKREIIQVTNTGDTVLNITLDLGYLKKFMVISEESFSLEAGESKKINIDIFAKENEVPDAYTGRIIVKGDGITKIINVIIEVKEKKPLFDIWIDVISKKVGAGRNVEANIKMINLGDLEHIDVLFYYAIKDFEGNIITFKEESIAIDRELDITRKLKVPDDLAAGDYIFYSKISYKDISATGADVFSVVKTGKLLSLAIMIILIILIIVIIILIILISRKNRKMAEEIAEIK